MHYPNLEKLKALKLFGMARALEALPRNRVPLDWARTETGLGNALVRLGERESGTASLQEAVAAYRAALKEYTRERARPRRLQGEAGSHQQDERPPRDAR